MRYLPTLLGCLLSVLCTRGLAQNLPPAPQEADFPSAFHEPYELTFIVDDLPPEYRGDEEVTFTIALLDDRDLQVVTRVLPANGQLDFQLPVNYPAVSVGISFRDYQKTCWVDGDLTVRINAILPIGGEGYSEQLYGPAAAVTMAYDSMYAQIDARLFEYSFMSIQKVLQDETLPMQTRYERALLTYDSLLTEHATYLQSKPTTFQAYWSGSLEHYFTDALASTGIGYEGELPVAMVEHIRAARPLLVEIPTAGNYWTQMLYYTRKAWQKKQSATSGTVADRHLAYARDAVRLLDERLPPAHADLLKLQFRNEDPRVRRAQLNIALATITTPWVREVMEKRISQLSQQIAALDAWLSQPVAMAAGNEFGKLSSTTSNEAMLYLADTSLTDTEFVQQLRAAFPGKALYIDFWATWCQGCLLQFPASKQLRGELTEDPVEFIYLCSTAGTDQKEWEATVAKWELSGTHVLVPADRMASLMRLFSFYGYPHYLLIRPDGSLQVNDLYPSDLTAEQLRSMLVGK